MTVQNSQRFTCNHPCPVCGGHNAMPQGKGVRCWGFLSDDGEWAQCSRSEHAGRAKHSEGSDTYGHSVSGVCPCGVEHSPSSPNPNGGQARQQYRPTAIVATFDYRDDHGELQYQAQRHHYTDGNGGKKFTLRRADGNGGWIEGPGCMKGVTRLPYRLPELPAAPMDAIIFIPEGEKNVEDIRSRGLIATCNSEGAKKFRPQLVHWFSGRKVVLLQDNDDDGRTHTDMEAPMLYPITEWVKVVAPPGLPEKGDITDWFDQGHTVEELMALVEATDEYQADDPTPKETFEWEQPLSLDAAYGPEFPVEVFPDISRRFVDAITKAIQVPNGLTASIALGVASSACSGKVCVRVHDEWKEPVNEYYLPVLPSGERKSETMRRVISPLEERQKELTEAMRPDIDRQAVEKDIKEKRLQELKNKAAKAPDQDDAELFKREAFQLAEELQASTVTPMPRLIADDTTPEAIASLLYEQGGRITLLSTEGGLFGTMAGRYSDGTANLDIFTKGYTGDPHRIDRKCRPPEYIPNPLITMVISPQPDVLAEIGANRVFRVRGLIARIRYIVPKSRVGYRSTDAMSVPNELRQGWSRAIKFLLKIPQPQDGLPHELHLSIEAQTTFTEYRKDIEINLRPAGEFEDIADWANRLPGTVARHAGILHMLACAEAEEPYPWSIPISTETMGNAISLGDYFNEHAKVAFTIMEADGRSAKARKVWASIQRHFQIDFTQRDLWLNVRRQFETPSELTDVLTFISDLGYIRQVPREDSRGPGRKPSPLYEINPLTRTHNTQNSERSDDSIDSVNSVYATPDNENFVEAADRERF